MKRLLLYHGSIGFAAILTWIALVVVEVKVREFWFFKHLFWSSLLLLFIAFPTASFVALRDRPESKVAIAVVSLFFVAPVFIVVGVILVWWLKMAIGGGVS
jgi:hypothetical protein